MTLPRVASGPTVVLLMLGLTRTDAGAQNGMPVRLAGEVRSGEAFVKPFAAGLVFHLTPATGPETSGWRIEIYSSHTTFPRGELSWVVSPPYRGNNPRYILVGHGQTAGEVAALSPRRFRFVTTLLDQFRADAAVGTLLWPGAAPEEHLEAARRDLDAIPTGDGKFSITDIGLVVEGDGKDTSIAWLKFEVELTLPTGPPARPPTTTGIRESPIEEALAEAFLADVPASDKCPENRAVATIASRSFGDVDGDGIEEAAVMGHSCLTGSRGPDLLVILKLQPSGELTRMPVVWPEDEGHGIGSWSADRRYAGVRLADGNVIALLSGPCANGAPRESSRVKRELVFAWNGTTFVPTRSLDRRNQSR